MITHAAVGGALARFFGVFAEAFEDAGGGAEVVVDGLGIVGVLRVGAGAAREGVVDYCGAETAIAEVGFSKSFWGHGFVEFWEDVEGVIWVVGPDADVANVEVSVLKMKSVENLRDLRYFSVDHRPRILPVPRRRRENNRSARKCRRFDILKVLSRFRGLCHRRPFRSAPTAACLDTLMVGRS